MSDRRRQVIWGGGGLALVVALYLLARVFVLGPAWEMRGKIANAREITGGLSTQLERYENATDRLRAVGSTMLAADRDVLEHRLRAGLSTIATDSGLSEVVVSNSPPRAVANPAAQVRMSGGWGKLRDRLRRQTDFYVVRGRVQGTGTLESAMLTLAAIEAQGWVHRIEGLTLRPVGAERELVELKVDFAIAMAPDLAPRDAPAHAPDASDTGDEAIAGLTQIALRGLFRVPPRAPEPAVVVETKPEPKPDPAPKPPPYENWRLAGVMGGNRVEAVVVHTSNGKSRVLEPGDRLMGATFEEGSGERAVFRIDEKRYEILLGKSLADRRELK